MSEEANIGPLGATITQSPRSTCLAGQVMGLAKRGGSFVR